MKQKETRARQAALQDKKQQLGLPDDEVLVLTGEGGSALTIPVGAGSLIAVAASVIAPEWVPGMVSYTLFALGLFGLAVVLAQRHKSTFYLTNYRFLLCRRTLFSQEPAWSVMYLKKICGYRSQRTLWGHTLLLTGQEASLHITGLSKAMCREIERIIYAYPGYTHPVSPK
ncbi:MAG: hypothetical protein QNJ97_26080 [Myxococcota bacterium]|nr:hypothetical protein [Myxococcota bacterium]